VPCDSRFRGLRFRGLSWLSPGQGRVPLAGIADPQRLCLLRQWHRRTLQGLPRDGETARQFFDPSLRTAWTAPRDQPYDFLVQSPTWKLGPVSTAILRKQFDKTYVAVSFTNHGRAMTLNFIVVNGPDGWVISDVESPHDSLRMFLDQFRR
jgi:hypothetical protein